MSADLAKTIPDVRRANKAQAAQFFDITLPTLEKWIREGAPIVQRGSKGISWVLDLRQISEWKYTSTLDGELDPNQLSPTDRKAWYESETKRRDLQIRDRELVPAAEVEQVVAVAFAAISQGLLSLPDNVERRTGCLPEVVEAVESVVHAELNGLADRLQDLAPVGEHE